MSEPNFEVTAFEAADGRRWRLDRARNHCADCAFEPAGETCDSAPPCFDRGVWIEEERQAAWIPASTRPKEEGWYLVTFQGHTGLRVGMGCFQIDPSGECDWISNTIIAWMPLPVPFRMQEVRK